MIFLECYAIYDRRKNFENRAKTVCCVKDSAPKEIGEMIDSSEFCVSCGQPLATESNRMICRKCENKKW